LPKNSTPFKSLSREGWGKKHQPKLLKVEIPEGEGVEDLVDPTVTEIMRRCGNKPGDMKMAQRVAKLYQNGSTETGDGTIPELITYDWLQSRQIPFTYQAWIYGGRSRHGGVIPDFVLEYNGKGMAWLIQGNYWHSKSEVSASDIIDKMKLVGSWFHGIYIEVVVELWENKVYHNRPEVFEMALLGIGLGQ
jgi:hypothetical protein